jgi:hypothetical protein
VIFNAGERVARVRTTNGGAALGAGVSDITQGGAADLVVDDNFVFGEPQALQVPGPDRTGPKLKLTGVKKSMKLAKFRKGVKVGITPDEECSLDVSPLAAARRATISAFNLTLASKSLGFSKAKRNLKLKPARKLIGKGEALQGAAAHLRHRPLRKQEHGDPQDPRAEVGRGKGTGLRQEAGLAARAAS